MIFHYSIKKTTIRKVLTASILASGLCVNAVSTKANIGTNPNFTTNPDFIPYNVLVEKITLETCPYILEKGDLYTIQREILP